MPDIAICLATWNGARHLSVQFESLAAQTFPGWHLYVRDDGSEDATLGLIEDFARRNAGRVTLVQDGCGRLGARGNFARLMEIVPGPYVAFADQDDVWRPDKLARAIDHLMALEAVHGRSKPAMVHADRRLIDAAGGELASSYWRSRGIVPERMQPHGHFSFCVAAGAAMLVNRALLDLALPVPPEARMYDCWLELVAQELGVVEAVGEIALDHRRHGANASGASHDIDSPAARRPWARAARLARQLRVQRMVTALYLRQAGAFRRRYGHRLPPAARQGLDLFLSLPERSPPGRLKALRASGMAPPGLSRTLVFAALAGGRGSARQTQVDM